MELILLRLRWVLRRGLRTGSRLSEVVTSFLKPDFLSGLGVYWLLIALAFAIVLGLEKDSRVSDAGTDLFENESSPVGSSGVSEGATEGAFLVDFVDDAMDVLLGFDFETGL